MSHRIYLALILSALLVTLGCVHEPLFVDESPVVSRTESPHRGGWKDGFDVRGGRFRSEGSRFKLNLADLKVQWLTDAGFSEVRVGDVNGDGALEVVAGGGRDIVIFDPSGKTLKRLTNVGYLNILADVTGDGLPEILVHDSIDRKAPSVWAYDCEGRLIKTYTKTGWECGGVQAVDVLDLDGDGDMELVVNTVRLMDGGPCGVVVFDAETCAEIGCNVVGPLPSVPISIGDIDGDGDFEIVHGCRTYGRPGFLLNGRRIDSCYIWALDHRARQIWRRGPLYAGSACHTTAMAADVDHDGRAEIIATYERGLWRRGGACGECAPRAPLSKRGIMMLDADNGGTMRHRERMFEGGVLLAAVADFEAGGDKEILVVHYVYHTRRYRLMVLRAGRDFRTVVEAELADERLDVLAVGNIDGERGLEIVVACDRELMVLSSDLKVKWRWAKPNYAASWAVTDAITADLDGDGRNEMVVACAGEGGLRIVVLGCPFKPGKKAEPAEDGPPAEEDILPGPGPE